MCVAVFYWLSKYLCVIVSYVMKCVCLVCMLKSVSRSPKLWFRLLVSGRTHNTAATGSMVAVGSESLPGSRCSVPRGAALMDPAHRALLRRLRLELSGQLLVSDAIVPLLFQEEVLTEAQVEDIESRSSERQKALRLLDLLPSRGPRAFPVFLRALDDFGWVRERLLEELRGEGPGSGSTEPQRLPEAVLARVPSDRELSRLAALLGARWEELLLELGLSAEDVFRCRSDHAFSSQAAALAGLIRWRRAGGRSATLRRLQDSLQVVDMHPSVLEDILTSDL